MNALIPEAWAQAAAPGGAGAGNIQLILMMLAFAAIFYFLLIRPQQKQLKDHQALLSRLAVGDEIVTTGGLLGRITDVGDTFVTLDLAEGVRGVKVQKAKIASVMPKGTLKKA